MLDKNERHLVTGAALAGGLGLAAVSAMTKQGRWPAGIAAAAAVGGMLATNKYVWSIATPTAALFFYYLVKQNPSTG